MTWLYPGTPGKKDDFDHGGFPRNHEHHVKGRDIQCVNLSHCPAICNEKPCNVRVVGGGIGRK